MYYSIIPEYFIINDCILFYATDHGININVFIYSNGSWVFSVMLTIIKS